MSRTSQNDRMLGESANFLLMQEHISRLAPLHKPVLIIGERGTGKELVAARLHFLSSRWDQNFLKINCAAFNDSLLESQLFGHEAGAFTGATKLQQGYFERAHKGTLFLDELANSSMSVQEKILRVTEYGEFERLGGTRPITVDVRIVAATNVDLPLLAEQGGFRKDLLDRLAFDVVTLPPLRERIEDIPILANQFAMDMVKELGREYFPGFSKAASKVLLEYQWPGNIRELKNVIERCVYRSEALDEPIKEIIFDPFASPYRPINFPLASTSSTGSSIAGPQAAGTFPTSTNITTPHATKAKGLKQQVQEFELAIISTAMEQSQFNQRKAAKLLNLSYDQLRGYLRKYDLKS